MFIMQGVQCDFQPRQTAPDQGIEQIMPILFPCAYFARFKYMLLVADARQTRRRLETNGRAMTTANTRRQLCIEHFSVRKKLAGQTLQKLTVPVPAGMFQVDG